MLMINTLKSMVHIAQINADKLICHVKKYQVVSFDVFDAPLKRNVGKAFRKRGTVYGKDCSRSCFI